MSNVENNEADFSQRIKGFNSELQVIMEKYELGFTSIPTVDSSRNKKMIEAPTDIPETNKSDKKTVIKLLHPPQEVFRDKGAETTRTLGQQTLFCYDRTEITERDGLTIWFKNVSYPCKGFPYPDAIKAIGLVKRATTIILKNFNPFKLLSKKIRRQAFGDYCYMSDVTLAGHYLKDEYLCPFAREVKKFLIVFLNEIGYSLVFADIFAFFVQYDDNYRYRLQDVVSESNADNFKHPQKELSRLLDISLERDTTNFISAVKFRLCVKFLNILLYFPKIKRAFQKALESIDFERMKFDEADRYFCLMRGDYDFFGLDIETRKAVFDKLTPITPKQLIF